MKSRGMNKYTVRPPKSNSLISDSPCLRTQNRFLELAIQSFSIGYFKLPLFRAIIRSPWGFEIVRFHCLQKTTSGRRPTPQHKSFSGYGNERQKKKSTFNLHCKSPKFLICVKSDWYLTCKSFKSYDPLKLSFLTYDCSFRLHETSTRQYETNSTEAHERRSIQVYILSLMLNQIRPLPFHTTPEKFENAAVFLLYFGTVRPTIHTNLLHIRIFSKASFKPE